MTYDELRAALNAYMHRTDPETVANEPNALELARVKLGRSFFPEAASLGFTLVFVDNLDGTASAPLPADFGKADTVYEHGVGDLEYLTPRDFAARRVSGELKGAFMLRGTEISGAGSLAGKFARLVYYRVPAPIAAAEQNWCSTSFPDVWLWQAIAEQHRFVQDGESAALAEGYADELAAAADTNTRANREGGALRMRSR